MRALASCCGGLAALSVGADRPPWAAVALAPWLAWRSRGLLLRPAVAASHGRRHGTVTTPGDPMPAVPGRRLAALARDWVGRGADWARIVAHWPPVALPDEGERPGAGAEVIHVGWRNSEPSPRLASANALATRSAAQAPAVAAAARALNVRSGRRRPTWIAAAATSSMDDGAPAPTGIDLPGQLTETEDEVQ